jgi:hypothetical protein
MPFDPPFDDAWWPNPGLSRNGPADADPGYWTDPFINTPATATNPFANVPPPWAAARLGAMAWHPPIFLGNPSTSIPSNFSGSGWPPPLPPAAPRSIASGLFPHDPSIPTGGLFPYPIGSTTDAEPSGLSDGFLGRRAATLTPALLAGLPRYPAARRLIDSAMFPRDPSLPSGGILGEVGRMAMRLMPEAPDTWPAPGWPAVPSPFAPLAQSQGPLPAGGPDISNGLVPSPTDSSATPAPPQRSVLFNGVPPAWDLGAHLLERDRDAATLDSTAQGLGPAELPLSKSGAPYVSPNPQPSIISQLSIEPWQWLDAARLLSPNLVDYFTKTLPPAPPFPSTPGKIPSLDNPYAVGAAIEAAALLPLGLERGIAGPLVRAASAVEKAATEAALQAAKSAAGAPARAGEQIVTGPFGKLSGTLPPGFQANHLNQGAVFNGFIPRDQGFSVGLRGNAFSDRDTPHYAFHQSLEQFWNQYRNGGSLYRSTPTNAKYGEAVRGALVAAGLPPERVSEFAAQAAAQRVANGLSETAPVPRIPGRINQRR